MWNFLKNPFKKKEAVAPRKSADAELEAQKEVTEKNPKQKAAGPRSEKKAEKKGQESKGSRDEHGTRLEAGFGVILKPHVSEKTASAGTYDTYSFVVSPCANKAQIARAFSKMYGVAPSSIQIANVSARATYFRRVAGVKSGWKKAYIRVPKGSTVAVYEGV